MMVNYKKKTKSKVRTTLITHLHKLYLIQEVIKKLMENPVVLIINDDFMYSFYLKPMTFYFTVDNMLTNVTPNMVDQVGS